MHPFSFTSELIDRGGMFSHILVVPKEVWQNFENPNHFRVVGTLNDVPFKLALHSSGDGDYHLVIAKWLRTKAKVSKGQLARLTLAPDPDGKAVHLPEELEIALEQEPDAAEKFFAFTPGYQRSLCYYVTQAKREETRIKRALDLVDRILNDELHRQKAKKEQGG